MMIEPSSVVLLTENGTAFPSTTVKLPCHRRCYICKARYNDLHFFYDQLCGTECAPLNFLKRSASADMRGKVAIVTGSRVKIGYHVALKLLRAGCTVVATTRFPNSAVDAFRKEEDFASFQDRLCVYGLDLRDVPGLEAFIQYLKQRFASSGIDVLINNACQTVRRPVGYYKPMVEMEHELWTKGDETHRTVLSGCLEFENLRRRVILDHERQQATQRQILPRPTAMDAVQAMLSDEPSSEAHAPASRPSTSLGRSTSAARAPFEQTGISHPAAMSQMIILPKDIGVNEDILPQGVSDINGQQLNLRKTNSWRLKMEEVSTPELMECMFVNAMAPFILNARLKPLMAMPATEQRPDRYIINVSAMEGKVSTGQTPLGWNLCLVDMTDSIKLSVRSWQFFRDKKVSGRSITKEKDRIVIKERGEH
jgi:NAD(P)-dependent dehydrogenase (short-subunit alcohol dehydrogenase family)